MDYTDKTILIADDDFIHLAATVRIAESITRKVIEAPDGLTALNYAKKYLPDLIVIDWRMPEMDGIEVIRHLKKEEATKDIPCILMTAAADSKEVLREAFEAGAADYINKPVEPVELKARIASFMRLSDSFSTIKNQNRMIMDSILYAHRIQEALVTSQEDIREAFPNSFLLYAPKDGLSGDFCWMAQKDSRQILVVADCTGHGVPGAMLSILGMSILSEAVNVKGHTFPDEILNYLHEQMHWKLRKEDQEEKDGMDVAVTVIDEKEQKVYFAGARSPLITLLNGNVDEIRGDRFSIGGYNKERKFTFKRNEISLKKGLHICMTSDGYTTQLGGNEYKKLGTQRFKDWMLNSISLNPDEKHTYLMNQFDRWRSEAGEIQMDDVTVLGVTL